MGYFYGKKGVGVYEDCYTYNDIIEIGGSVVENDNGTVSVYTPIGPIDLDNFCCSSLKSGYYFDSNNQTCRWSTIGKVCSLDSFKLTLNPIGNDGNIFYVDKNIKNTEKCSLNIEFDYIFKVSCESLTNILVKNNLPTTNANGCLTPIDVLENLDVSVLLEYVDSADELVTVETYPLFTPIGTGNLYNYLTTNTNSGFLVCGEPNKKEQSEGITGCTPIHLESNSTKNVSTCNGLITNIVNGLLTQSTLDKDTFDASFNKNSLASNWLHYQTIVSSDTILSQIENKKIKISIQVNSSCGKFCILLDNIKLNKDCSLVTENNMFISTPPSFNLTRVIDNKKSWIANTAPENRPFHISNALGGSDIRQTNYNVNDERLVINTKEIDLDMNIASAIETDVWCYISDNPCLLTATTVSYCDCLSATCCNSDSSVDYTSLMTQPLSDVKTVEEFGYYLNSELIDAKSRKTLSAYPTLRALYDRYTNSIDYCATTSSSFDYTKIDKFSSLIDSYWVDIVEQVIPATTIWGSVKVYGNTIFDQQKFQYRKGSLFTCTKNCPSLNDVNIGAIAIDDNVGVDTSVIGSNKTQKYIGVYIKQINNGSEFIGTITNTNNGIIAV